MLIERHAQRWCKVVYEVNVDRENDLYTYECGMFKHSGLLCRHVLKVMPALVSSMFILVFQQRPIYHNSRPDNECNVMYQVMVHVGLCQIPARYIMKRWTKDATDNLPEHLKSYMNDVSAQVQNFQT